MDYIRIYKRFLYFATELSYEYEYRLRVPLLYIPRACHTNSDPQKVSDAFTEEHTTGRMPGPFPHESTRTATAVVLQVRALRTCRLVVSSTAAVYQVYPYLHPVCTSSYSSNITCGLAGRKPRPTGYSALRTSTNMCVMILCTYQKYHSLSGNLRTVLVYL